MFNEEVLKAYKRKKLADIKKDCLDKAWELSEDFKEAETNEFRYAIAQDFITQINTVREIEKEIEKEKEEKKIDK